MTSLFQACSFLSIVFFTVDSRLPLLRSRLSMISSCLDDSRLRRESIVFARTAPSNAFSWIHVHPRCMHACLLDFCWNLWFRRRSLATFLERFFVRILQGKAASVGISNFVPAFKMVSLNSPSSGTMKQMPPSLRALSSFGETVARFMLILFSDLLSTCGTKSQTTNNQVLTRSPDHIKLSGGFSLNIVNFVNPVHESDKLRFTLTFQSSTLQLSATHPDSCAWSWSRQCVSEELTSKFDVVTTNEITFH